MVPPSGGYPFTPRAGGSAAARPLRLARRRNARGLSAPRECAILYYAPNAGYADLRKAIAAQPRRLLLDRGVGLALGCAFGAGGEGHVRICFAVEEGILVPALERLAEFLEQGDVR